MAEWLVVYRGAVLRKCEAPDKTTATERLKPDSSKGEMVKSRASYDLDGARDNVVQKCMYGCGRDSAPDAKSCVSCAKQRAVHRVRPPREPAPEDRLDDQRRRPHTAEHKALVAGVMRGRPLAPSHAENVRKALLARNAEPWSEERRARHALAQQKLAATIPPEVWKARSEKMHEAKRAKKLSQPSSGAVPQGRER